MKRILSTLFLLVVLALLLCACKEEHVHNFGEWTNTVEPSCEAGGISERSCIDCGFVESQTLEALGHHEVVDAAVRKTCSKSGLTSGSHCKRCGLVIKEQQDTGFAEHSYTKIDMERAADCTQSGIKRITCEKCGDYYTESIFLKELNSEEVYDTAQKHIAIVNAGADGFTYSIGIGFAYEDSDILITNYSVVKGSKWATFTLNGKTYNVRHLIAYDEESDLAILTTNSNDLDVPFVCENKHANGSDIYFMGFSESNSKIFYEGTITSSYVNADGVHVFEHDALVKANNRDRGVRGVIVNSYGEIIGISSSDTEYAVWTSEIGKLEKGSALTLGQHTAAITPKIDASIIDRCIDWLENEDNGYCHYFAGTDSDLVYIEERSYDVPTMYLVYECYYDSGEFDEVVLLIDKNGIRAGFFQAYDENGKTVMVAGFGINAITHNQKTRFPRLEKSSLTPGFDEDYFTDEVKEYATEAINYRVRFMLLALDEFLTENDLGSIEDLGFISFKEN